MADFLKGDVKLPGIGTVPKAGVAIGVGGVGLLIWYKRTHPSTAAAATTATTTPVTGTAAGGDPYPWDGTYNNPNDPNSMDTSTGSTYGDEGSGSPFGGGGGGSTGGTTGPPFSTNAQWSQYAIATLGSGGATIDLTGLTTALGAYIAGAKVTAAQESLINDAIAVAGTPPVAGPNGMPPAINVTGGKGGGGGKVDNPVQGLKVTDQGSTSVDIGWTATPNATSYSVTGYPNIQSTGATAARIRDLGIGGHPKSATISVKANPARSGQPTASVKVSVK